MTTTTLRTATEEELRAELKRREEEPPRPKLRRALKLQEIIDICESELDELQEDAYAATDPTVLYDAVLRAVYGPRVFEWITTLEQHQNARCRSPVFDKKRKQR